MMPTRSKLEALSEAQRLAVRDGAMARAQQGLPRVQTLANVIPPTGQAPQRGGTNNGRGFGTSSGDGVELLANVIRNGVEARNKMREPRTTVPLKPYMPSAPAPGQRGRGASPNILGLRGGRRAGY